MSGEERGNTVHLTVREHTESLRHQLRTLLEHQPLFNVACLCSDQTVRTPRPDRPELELQLELLQVNYNRLAIGLIFPQLQDHDLVLCPDFSSRELADNVKRTLGSGSDQEKHRGDSEESAGLDNNGNDSSSGQESLRDKVSRKKPSRKTKRQMIRNRSKASRPKTASESSSFSEDENSLNIKSPPRKSLKKRVPAKEVLSGRKGRCMSCSSCLKPDCRTCKYCLDMKKYGGPGVKKQSCEFRPKCAANDRESAKRKKIEKDGETARTSSDLDEVESIEVPIDVVSKDETDRQAGEIRSTDKIQQDQSPLSPASSTDSSISQQSLTIKLYTDEEPNCANPLEPLELKCTHCEFIGKTQTGLKKHRERYHRSSLTAETRSDGVPAPAFKRKIVLDTWQLNCPSEDINNCQKKPKQK